MSLEQLCLEQEAQISRQSAIIMKLLAELMQFRQLAEEELKMMEDDNK